MITFSGIDCSGKSTQIAQVKAALEAKGRRVHVVWSRIGFTRGIMLLKRLLRPRRRTTDAVDAPASDRAASADRPLSRMETLYMLLSIWDITWLYAVDIRLAELLGRVVICDRYLLDSLVDYRLHYPRTDFTQWRSWRLLERLAVKPRHAIILVIPPEEAERRIVLKGELHPDPPARRAARIDAYLRLVDEGRWTQVIDGTRPRADITSDILQQLSL